MSLRFAPRTALAALLAWAACGGLSACSGCGKADVPPVLGREGRERWVVTFDGPAPDLTEYRKLLKDDPETVAAYVDKARARQAQAHPELDASLGALGGAVVERWWMSNQVTVEVPPTGVPTVKAVPGVKEVVPDGLFVP